jgi:hypothetical protein
VCHRSRWGRAVPVSLFRRAPDHIAGTNFDFLLAFTLYPATARGDNERLPQRMPVPRGVRARLKRHARATHACRIGRASNNGSIRTVPVKYSSGPLAEGCVPFLLNSMMNLQVIAILLWSSRAVANNPGSTYLDFTQHWKEQILAAHCLSLVTERCVIPAKTEPSFWDKEVGERIDEILSNSSEKLAPQRTKVRGENSVLLIDCL